LRRKRELLKAKRREIDEKLKMKHRIDNELAE